AAERLAPRRVLGAEVALVEEPAVRAREGRERERRLAAVEAVFALARDALEDACEPGIGEPRPGSGRLAAAQEQGARVVVEEALAAGVVDPARETPRHREAFARVGEGVGERARERHA